MIVLSDNQSATSDDANVNEIYEWLSAREDAITLLPVPFALVGLLAALVTFVIATDLKRNTASKSVLKYVAIFDALLCCETLHQTLISING